MMMLVDQTAVDIYRYLNFDRLSNTLTKPIRSFPNRGLTPPVCSGVRPASPLPPVVGGRFCLYGARPG
ncbi:MAG: hypothetical protein GPOALKHO_001370 [Sodalis sp.]|nr:MAG: hypothetical protein GPOALKHO_001370 [Sodalis sp.]